MFYEKKENGINYDRNQLERVRSLGIVNKN